LTLRDPVGEDSGLQRQIGVLVVSVGGGTTQGALQSVSVAELVRCLERADSEDRRVELEDVLERQVDGSQGIAPRLGQ